MNEKPKTIWKRRFSPWIQWFVLVVATYVVIISIGCLIDHAPKEAEDWLAPLLLASVFATLVLAAFYFTRWLLCWRNLRRLLFGIACLATLIALFYAEEDLRGKWAWNHFKRELEARGEQVDLAKLVPPPVPDDQNFALTPIMFSTYGSMVDKTGHAIQPPNTNVVNRLDLKIYRDDDWDRAPTNGNWAKGTLTDLVPWQAYYRTLPTNRNTRVTTNEFPTSPQPQSPAQDVLLALSKYDSIVEELRRASRMPYSRFPLEYDKDDPAAILLPHLAREKISAQFLQLRAIAELQSGQTEQAAADIKLMCYLIGASQAEPILISQLVRIAMLNYALQPIYEGLAEHRWSDAQLTAFDSDLGKMDFLADYQHSMRSEAAFLTAEIDHIQRTRKVSPYFNAFNQGRQYGFPGIDLVCWLAPSGWFHQNQIRYCEFYLQQCLPVVNLEREVSPKAAAEAQASLDTATDHPTPYTAFQYIFYMPVKQWLYRKYVSADKFAYAQASVDLARVAIALERYRLAHGNYPESLDLLTPQFIKTRPRDVIGGGPLHYRRADSGRFVLYSVGWNGKDDGGSPVLNKSLPGDESSNSGVPDTEKGDWVWAYPVN